MLPVADKLKSWALTAWAVLLVLVGAYVMGGRASRRATEKKHNYNEALRSAAGAKGVHDAEIETTRMPDGGAADQLRRDWMRDDAANDGGAKGDRGDRT